jgi:hypothetical protein
MTSWTLISGSAAIWTRTSRPGCVLQRDPAGVLRNYRRADDLANDAEGDFDPLGPDIDVGASAPLRTERQQREIVEEAF